MSRGGPSPMGRSSTPERDSQLPTFRQSLSRLRYLVGFAKPYRTEFWASIVTNVAVTVFSLLIPICFKQAIDDGVAKHHVGTVEFYVVCALAASLAMWVCSIVLKRTTMFGIRVLNDLRVALFAHIQRQGLDFFHNMLTGVVISRLTNDVDAIENMVTDGIYTVFSNVLMLVGVEAFLFVLNWRLALATNTVMPLMLVATTLFRYYSMRAYQRTRERLALVTAFLAESLAGIRVVQAFAAEERMALQFDDTNEHYKQANMDTIYLSAGYFPGAEFLAVLATGIVLWYGGILHTSDAVTFGVLFAFVNYLDNFFTPIQNLSQFYSSYLSAMAALDKIMQVMDTKPTIVDADDARTLPAVRGEVRFEDVSFAYSPGAPEVLHDVDFHVQPGETIALVGHTGAGKSTIVKLLTRFHDPTAGRVLLDGVDLRDLQSRWLRSSLGIVPQEGFLFSSTIAENIRFGRPDASDDDMRAAARAVGADEFIEALEQGYDTEVGERGGHLSAGQRQLIAFARALLADPKLLVLDEATASVDIATELRLAEGLRALVAGRTAFIVAHRLSTIRDADRIFVVDDGRIVERGTHDELIGAGGFYSALYSTWTREGDAEAVSVQ